MSSTTLHTDQHLLAAIRSGDPDAFRTLYDRYWERMSLYALKVIRDPAEAGDIVQEVFISIWKRRESLEIRGPLPAYLMRSVRNLCLRHIEKNIHQRDFLASLSDQLGALDLSSVNTLEIQELEERLTLAIDRLPAKMQEVFRLSRYENLSYKEIAQRLDIAENTVKKQVHNALRQIRSDLGAMSTTALLLWQFFRD